MLLPLRIGDGDRRNPGGGHQIFIVPESSPDLSPCPFAVALIKAETLKSTADGRWRAPARPSVCPSGRSELAAERCSGHGLPMQRAADPISNPADEPADAASLRSREAIGNGGHAAVITIIAERHRQSAIKQLSG